VKLFGNYTPEHVGKWMINKYDELAKKEAVKKPAAKSPAVKPTTTATPAATAA